jgi:hypothetical protein
LLTIQSLYPQHVEHLVGPRHIDALVGLHFEQMPIPRDYEFGPAGRCGGQEHVVAWVAGDDFRRTSQALIRCSSVLVLCCSGTIKATIA